MTDYWHPAGPDPTRPLILGYVRAALCRSEHELAETRGQLAEFARKESYTMGSVFTEHPRSAPAAFSALIDAVKHYDARAIVVPSPEHLEVLGAPPPLTQYVQSVTGVPLLIVQNAAPGNTRTPRPPLLPP